MVDQLRLLKKQNQVREDAMRTVNLNTLDNCMKYVDACNLNPYDQEVFHSLLIDISYEEEKEYRSLAQFLGKNPKAKIDEMLVPYRKKKVKDILLYDLSFLFIVISIVWLLIFVATGALFQTATVLDLVSVIVIGIFTFAYKALLSIPKIRNKMFRDNLEKKSVYQFFAVVLAAILYFGIWLLMTVETSIFASLTLYELPKIALPVISLAIGSILYVLRVLYTNKLAETE